MSKHFLFALLAFIALITSSAQAQTPGPGKSATKTAANSAKSKHSSVKKTGERKSINKTAPHKPIASTQKKKTNTATANKSTAAGKTSAKSATGNASLNKSTAKTKTSKSTAGKSSTEKSIKPKRSNANGSTASASNAKSIPGKQSTTNKSTYKASANKAPSVKAATAKTATKKSTHKAANKASSEKATTAKTTTAAGSEAAVEPPPKTSPENTLMNNHAVTSSQALHPDTSATTTAVNLLRVKQAVVSIAREPAIPYAPKAIDVTDQTIRLGAGQKEELMFSFAAGEKIIFSFEEADGKELNEFQVIEQPAQSRFSAYKSTQINNKEILVQQEAIYVFRMRNTSLSKRICKLRIQRVPAPASSEKFEPAVSGVIR